MKSFKTHETLLHDFINDLKMFASTGITIPSAPHGEKFYGYLFAYHADALAAHQLCGFKECFLPSSSFPLPSSFLSLSSPLVQQQCRICTASFKLFPKLSYHSQSPLRDEMQHYRAVQHYRDEMKEAKKK